MAAAAATAACPLCLALADDTDREGPCDWVKDDGARGLGDGPAPAHVEEYQSRDVVEAVLLELEELPGVAL